MVVKLSGTCTAEFRSFDLYFTQSLTPLYLHDGISNKRRICWAIH